MHIVYIRKIAIKTTGKILLYVCIDKFVLAHNLCLSDQFWIVKWKSYQNLWVFFIIIIFFFYIIHIFISTTRTKRAIDNIASYESIMQ
jgi:hypothetical protein